ncbi:hypothetical protein PFMALIP_01764 [Plasmodium falciparum MaliPS096_E11]|uniref:Uncharacterized protein n=1 Tax=Plasmodium falciparum MaliPS096_E11 TaxID=1036727 RepID=A0A024WSN9_PLAFA|nr:hypothetical protein PFMALIP_01764 [Plasmodium falciparum MaliPS096_E11]
MSHNPASILLFTVQGLLASLTCGLCCYLYSYCYNGRFFKNGRGSNRNNKKRSISSVEGDFPNSKKCKKGHINHECSNNKEENKILIKEDEYETYDTYKTHDIYIIIIIIIVIIIIIIIVITILIAIIMLYYLIIIIY